MQFRINQTHPSLNKWCRAHYHVVAKEKAAWEALVWGLTRNMPNFEGPVTVKVDYYFPTKAKRDIDNYTPKFLLDGCVKAGLIEDDNNEIVKELSVTINYEKRQSYTIVTITKV